MELFMENLDNIQEDSKKLLGQFFTITNPFNIDIFYKWMKLIPEEKKTCIIEPFAGANNIVKMIQDLEITILYLDYLKIIQM